MVKATLAYVVIFACTAAHAFVPARIRLPLPPCRSTSVAKGKVACFPREQRCKIGAHVDRTVRTTLFSASTASNDQPYVAPGEAPASAVPAEQENKAPGLIKVGAYFGLWYLLNIGYNIYNKRLLNIYPLPWLMASVQLGVGILYVVPLWLTKLRRAPKLNKGALTPLWYVVTAAMLAR